MVLLPRVTLGSQSELALTRGYCLSPASRLGGMRRQSRFWSTRGSCPTAFDFGATRPILVPPTILVPPIDHFRNERPNREVDSECREAAIGSSPEWSDDELRESSGTRGLPAHQRWRRAIDSQTQSNPPSRNRADARRQSRQQRCPPCRLRLGRIERCGESLARRRSSRFVYPGLRLTRKASLRSPGATSGRRLRGLEKEGTESILLNAWIGFPSSD